uniref:Uncharacterized protein n=1 Tax=Lutzomyia longipalpis TaxID=7200 RepID=A0A1B0CKD6_LUTLO
MQPPPERFISFASNAHLMRSHGSTATPRPRIPSLHLFSAPVDNHSTSDTAIPVVEIIKLPPRRGPSPGVTTHSMLYTQQLNGDGNKTLYADLVTTWLNF